MTPESDKRLRENYPLVFQGPLLNDEPIRCGDGWYFILDMLCRNLTHLIEKKPEAERHRYRAAQVKEKFGTLRFYLHHMDPDPMGPINREIAGAEWASGIICDVCGKPGTLRSDGGEYTVWVRVRCDEHADTRPRP